MSDEENQVHGRMPQNRKSAYGFDALGCVPGITYLKTNVYTRSRSSGLTKDQKNPRTEPR